MFSSSLTCLISGWSVLLALACLQFAPSAHAGRRTPARIRLASVSPHWTRSFQVRAGGTGTSEKGGLPASSVSMLSNRKSGASRVWMSPLGLPVNTEFFDERQASAWRQRSEDNDRNLKAQQSWGLTGLEYQRARLDASNALGNEMFVQIQDQEKNNVTSRAVGAYKRDANLQAAAKVIAPAALVAGIYMGEPLRWSVTDSTHMMLRTDFRTFVGAFELNSILFDSRFDFRPNLADSRDPGIPAAGSIVSPGAAMGAGTSVNFSLERYQVSFSRSLPFLGLQSAVLYGSSSHAVMGSLSKQLVPHVSVAVDSTRWLSATDLGRESEEKIRLRYDIHF